MNKTIVVMMLLLALAGCSAPAPEAAPADSAASTAGDSGASAPAASASESISDLASVFGMSGSFKCEYRVDNVVQVSQVKDGKMRSDATVDVKETHTIFSGETFWMWSDQGCFMMNMADIKALGESMPQGQQAPQTREDVARNAVDVKCERASVPDSAFTPPSGCQDMGAMFKQMQNFQR